MTKNRMRYSTILITLFDDVVTLFDSQRTPYIYWWTPYRNLYGEIFHIPLDSSIDKVTLSYVES
jgi:hypothetical protein